MNLYEIVPGMLVSSPKIPHQLFFTNITIAFESGRCEIEIGQSDRRLVTKYFQTISFTFSISKIHRPISVSVTFDLPSKSLSHYFFRLTDVKEVYARNEFATLEITLVLKRNDPYYTLTWFVPIMVLTFLTPIGLILPGEFLNISDIFDLGVITI